MFTNSLFTIIMMSYR